MTSIQTNKEAPLISCRNVGVSYWLKRGAIRRERFWPLNDVSFELHKGESLGVIGKNGCGKSTLLRLLANTMSPDRGEIIGADNLRISLLSLRLGFVNYLPGRENAILSGMFLGMTKNEIESRMDEIIDFSELGEFIDQPLSTYSSGMAARLGFAVAFQLNPDVLLIDEVLSVGDLAFREKSHIKMKERIISNDSTVVFVSHSGGQVKNMCDRAIWIDDGIVRAAGNVDDVVKEYENSSSTTSSTTSKPNSRITPTPKSEIQPTPNHFFFRKENEKHLYIFRNGTGEYIEKFQNFVALGGKVENIHILPEEIFKKLF